MDLQNIPAIYPEGAATQQQAAQMQQAAAMAQRQADALSQTYELDAFGQALLAQIDEQIAESGSPDELMAQKGIYAHMHQLQTQSQSWVMA